jgi:hypothetical protein
VLFIKVKSLETLKLQTAHHQEYNHTAAKSTWHLNYVLVLGNFVVDKHPDVCTLLSKHVGTGT